jgi:hypothetical protein
MRTRGEVARGRPATVRGFAELMRRVAPTSFHSRVIAGPRGLAREFPYLQENGSGMGHSFAKPGGRNSFRKRGGVLGVPPSIRLRHPFPLGKRARRGRRLVRPPFGAPAARPAPACAADAALRAGHHCGERPSLERLLGTCRPLAGKPGPRGETVAVPAIAGSGDGSAREAIGGGAGGGGATTLSGVRTGGDDRGGTAAATVRRGRRRAGGSGQFVTEADAGMVESLPQTAAAETVRDSRP